MKSEKMSELRAEIKEVKRQIAKLGDMLPGSLTRQKRDWGKEYWQLSYTHRGKGGTRYVSEENYETVKSQVENYRKFRKLCKRLVDLSLNYAKLRYGKRKLK
jgi:hypothetical protein